MKRRKDLLAIGVLYNMFITHMTDKIVFPKGYLVSVLIFRAHWAGQWNICARTSM